VPDNPNPDNPGGSGESQPNADKLARYFLQPVRDRQVIVVAGQHLLLPRQTGKARWRRQSRFALRISWRLALDRTAIK
jgi:hypothetical protein